MTGPLDQRIDVLERSVRRWRLMSVAGVGLAIAAIAAAANTYRVRDAVRARAFLLVDAAGEVTAKLVTRPGAGPVLFLTNPEIGADVMVGSFGPDAGIAISGRDGAVASLAVGKLGGPALSLSEKDLKVLVGTGDGQSPVTWLRDSNGSLVATPSRLFFQDGEGRTTREVELGDDAARSPVITGRTRTK